MQRETESPGSSLTAMHLAPFGLVILLVVPLIVFPNVESFFPWLTLLLSTAAATTCEIAAYRLPWSPPDPQPAPSRVPALVVAATATAYAVVATVYSVNHHHNLGTTVFDLSIYDNIFYQTVHGKPLGTTLIATGYHTAAHFDPLLVVLSPLYLLYPRAELLLALQSVWLASAALPLYFLARHVLGRPWPAVAVACTLLLHPAVHGANFYDFHSLTLIAPLFLWAIYFVETRAVRRYWIVLVLLLLAREDVPLLTCFLGLYVLMNRRSRDLGLLTISISIVYFVAVRFFIMTTAGEDAHSYAYYYRGLIPEDGGPASLLVTVLTKPIATIKHVLSPPKLLWLATMYVPVMFLPLLAPRGKILMVYGLAVILLASRSAVYSVHFQYTSILYPAIFVLVLIALAGLRENRLVRRLRFEPNRLTRALVAGMLVASVLVSAKFGGLLPNDSFRSGFGPFRPYMTKASRATYQWVEKTTAQIPKDASVAASKHMAPHVSNRYSIHRFPRGGWGADFLFVDRGELKEWPAANLEMLLSNGAYEIESEREGRFALLRRVEHMPLPDRLPD